MKVEHLARRRHLEHGPTHAHQAGLPPLGDHDRGRAGSLGEGVEKRPDDLTLVEGA
jgi:hypothetical protein